MSYLPRDQADATAQRLRMPDTLHVKCFRIALSTRHCPRTLLNNDHRGLRTLASWSDDGACHCLISMRAGRIS